jgi:hypothetical protein
MRPFLAGMKGLNWAFNIGVIIVLILAVVPVLPGNFSVVLPGPDSWTVDIDENNVTMSSYIRFLNNGVYDIEDLSFSVQLGLGENESLMDFHSRTMNITTGTWYWMELSFVLGLSTLRSKLASDIVYSGANLSVKVHANGNYILGLAHIEADYESSLMLGPLITDKSWNTTGFAINTIPGGGEISLPLRFNASSWLIDSPLILSLDLWNGTALYGHSIAVLVINATNEPVITLEMNDTTYKGLQTTAQQLTLDLTLDLYGVQSKWVTIYDWSPPDGD